MSDSREAKAARAAQLAERLLFSAKSDGLDDAALKAVGTRMFPTKAAASAKIPVLAMLVFGGMAAIGGVAYTVRHDRRSDGYLDDARVASSVVVSTEHVTSESANSTAKVANTTQVEATVRPAIDETTTVESPSGVTADVAARAPERSVTSAEPVVAPSAPAAAPASVAVGLLPDAPPTTAPRPRASASASSSAAQIPTDLPGELRALERAHRAVADKNVAEAKAALADYARSFPHKLLAQEARVLDIEVLLAEGRTDEAEASARRFLAGAGADGPYAARVRSLIARPKNP